MAQTRISQAVIEVPEIGSPQGRLTQVALEVPQLGSPQTRESQLVLEVLYNTISLSTSNTYYILTPTMN